MRPKVLCLTHRFPYPPNRGDRIRSYQVLRYLAERADVDLATLADETPADAHVAKLTRLCRRMVVKPIGRWRWAHAAGQALMGRSASEGLFLSTSLRREIREWTAETQYDAAVVVCSGMAPYVRAFQRPPRRTIVDLVDVDSQKWLDYAESAPRPAKWLFGLEGQRLRRLERSLAEGVDAVTLVSELERKLFETFCPNSRALSVINGVDMKYFQPIDAVEAETSVVFVGALDYRANVLGIRWFVENVWPSLKNAVPSASLSIVGRKPTPQVRSLEQSPGVRVFGDVADVRPHLGRAAVAIAPLQVARGIQNKVLEAMAMAKSVVASPQALEGISAIDDVHVCVADKAEHWVEQILRLWRQPESRQVMGRQARQFVEDEHCWSACLSPLEELLDLPPAHGRPVRANSSLASSVQAVNG